MHAPNRNTSLLMTCNGANKYWKRERFPLIVSIAGLGPGNIMLPTCQICAEHIEILARVCQHGEILAREAKHLHFPLWEKRKRVQKQCNWSIGEAVINQLVSE